MENSTITFDSTTKKPQQTFRVGNTFDIQNSDHSFIYASYGHL